MSDPFLKDPRWVFEIHEGRLALGFRRSKILFDRKSPFQRVQVAETLSLGRMLLTDGVVMTSEADEFIYHEMLSHVPLFTHPCPKNILIIGGGDGGTAREALKHPSVESCLVAEIDPLVVEASKKHLPFTAKSFKHPKLSLRFQDGAQFIESHPGAFDVILVDSGDPIGPAKKLFGKRFYKALFHALKDDGLMAAQGESPFYNLSFQKRLLAHAGAPAGASAAAGAGPAGAGFKIAGFYHYSNMTYPCGLWSFLFASKKYHPLRRLAAPRPLAAPPASMRLKYYNEEIHRAAFARPEFLKRRLAPLWKI